MIELVLDLYTKKPLDKIISEIGDKYMKKIYIVDNIFNSSKIIYMNLVVDSSNYLDYFVTDIDDKNEYLNKTVYKILITDIDFIIVGFNDDDRINVISSVHLDNFPTSILYGYREEYGYNYNEKIVLPHFDYDTYLILIDSFYYPQILTYRYNIHILRAADLVGLVNPITCIINDGIDTLLEKEKRTHISKFFYFYRNDSKILSCFCSSIEEYKLYSKILDSDRSFIPIQILYDNYQSRPICINIFNGIPILYTKHNSSVKHMYTIDNFEKKGDINKLRSQMIEELCKQINDENILSLSSNRKIITNMISVLDFNCFGFDFDLKIYAKIIEGYNNPKLLYNSNEINYCNALCDIYNSLYDNLAISNAEIISINDFVAMNDAKNRPYPYDFTNVTEKNSDLEKCVKYIEKHNMYKYNTNPTTECIRFDTHISVYMGFFRPSVYADLYVHK